MTFIEYANAELSKGFKFTADQILVNVKINLVLIARYEEMIKVIEIGESDSYYMVATLKIA